MATSSDRDILKCIFNPFQPLGEGVCDGDDDDDDDNNPVDCNDDDDGSCDMDNIKMAKDLEVKGVNFAEQGDLQRSLELFTMAIQIAPDRASGYNNRAQALRLTLDITGAERDLEKAIELSGGRGRVAAQAYSQRAVIRQLFRGDLESSRRDYETAAKLGNEAARVMAAQLNPYAALCNQMLGRMMDKLLLSSGSDR